MLEPKPDPDNDRAITQADILSTAVRVTLSSALPGPLGALVSEFVTQFIPQQRQDRLQQFVEELNEKFEGLQAEMRARLEASQGFAVLTEEVCLSAVRTQSNDRRRALAALLRDGFSRGDAELEDSVTLVRILNELNDTQLLLLVFYDRFGLLNSREHRIREFLERNPGLFPSMPTLRDAPEVVEAWAMHEHYVNELVNLHLLRDREDVVKSSNARVVEITPLGGNC